MDKIEKMQRFLKTTLTGDFESKMAQMNSRIAKIEFWKQEVIKHFEQTLPFQIAGIAFQVGIPALAKKKMRGKYAKGLERLLDDLLFNQ